MEGSALSSHLDSELTQGTTALHRRALRGATALLFVAGLTLGAIVHVGHGGAGSGAAGTQVSAWLALPENGGGVTAVVARPTTTSASPGPATAAPPPLVATPPRSAATTAPTDPPTAAGRVSEALARISYPWRQLGYRIVFLGPEAGMWGRTSQRSLSTIDIYVRPDESVDMLAHVVAHEIGHAVDLVYGTDQRLSLWLELRGISPRPWFTCSMCQDFSTPAGDFAEVFAYWQLGDFSRSELAPPPTPAQLSQLSTLFAPPS